MKITAVVHKSAPRHGAGAEWYIQETFEWLIQQGHEVCVLTPHKEIADLKEFNGVQLGLNTDFNKIRWADILVTHLDMTREAMMRSRRFKKPLVHFVHNHRQLNFNGVRPKTTAGAIFNSKWTRDSSSWTGKEEILYPPISARRVETNPGDRVTLINMSQAKGGEIFWELAVKERQRRFLGVQGAYAHQILDPVGRPNVRIVKNTPDIRDIYSKTRVLLMPSSYESWGRVALEAAVSGIPTIYYPTPGLKESIGSAGIPVESFHKQDWSDALAQLDDPKTYKKYSTKARQRYQELKAIIYNQQLPATEKFLLESINNFKGY